MQFAPTTLAELAQFGLPKNLQMLLAPLANATGSTGSTGSTANTEGLPRRSFLKLGALSGISGFALGAFPLGALAQDAAKPAGLTAWQQPSAFVQIAVDGTTTINRLDFGHGVQTALPMILAEELDADWSKVKSVHGSSDPAYIDPLFGMHITGGSGSIAHSYTQYRELGARTRAMLLAAAAARWGTDVSALRTANGLVLR